MTDLEQTKSILETIRLDLKREKEEVVAILKDPKVAEWATIDLPKYQAMLALIGIDPAGIGSALVEYPKQAKKIGKQIADWGNEIGNQLADLIAHPEPQTALPAAKKLSEKCQGITALKEELLVFTSRLVRADQILRQQLNLRALLPIARLVSGGRKDLFESGMATFGLLVGDIGQKTGARTLADMIQETARMTASYQRLDITKLPRIVEEILFHHIDEAIHSIKHITIFLGAIHDRLARDVKSVEVIEKNLTALQAVNTTALLNGIAEQGGALANLIIALYHKRGVNDSLGTVCDALEFLEIFHLTLKRKLIASLQKEVELAGSPLNPITISAKMTKTFFMGATGIIRSLKLMVTSLTGKSAVSETELQLTLENGIANCKHFYGKSPADIQKMKAYIDTLVGHYPKPFPYNDLFKLVKTTLSLYGDAVEKFIHGYDIPRELMTTTMVSVPAKLGKLMVIITKHRAVFEKTNTDQGNELKAASSATVG